jgi:hypothetical protein
LKKIRHLDIIFEKYDGLWPVSKGLYTSLAQFTELVKVNYVVHQIEWKEENWNEECVDGRMWIDEAGRMTLLTSEALEVLRRAVGRWTNISEQDITKMVQKIKEVKFGCKWILSEDIDLNPTAADCPAALGQAVNEREMA